MQEGGTRRITDLAHELDTTPQLIDAMLEDLEQMGYVKRLRSECGERCGSCPMSEVCAAGGSLSGENDGKVWVLTGTRRQHA